MFSCRQKQNAEKKVNKKKKFIAFTICFDGKNTSEEHDKRF